MGYCITSCFVLHVATEELFMLTDWNFRSRNYKRKSGTVENSKETLQMFPGKETICKFSRKCVIKLEFDNKHGPGCMVIDDTVPKRAFKSVVLSFTTLILFRLYVSPQWVKSSSVSQREIKDWSTGLTVCYLHFIKFQHCLLTYYTVIPLRLFKKMAGGVFVGEPLLKCLTEIFTKEDLLPSSICSSYVILFMIINSHVCY